MLLSTPTNQPGDLAPDWYTTPELAAVLSGHDVGALLRWLNAAGLSQHQIARLIGTTQPQVADIITGRRTRVQSYEVLVRTAEGLTVPRERMGLSFWGPEGRYYGPPGTYPGDVTVTHTPEGVSSAMLRRHLIAWGAIIMTGLPASKATELKVGELLTDPGELPPVPLPSRLTSAHVVQMQDLRQRLEESRRTFGGDPTTSSGAAARAERWLTVDGPEPVTQAMLAAVAQLHIHAGLAAFDAGLGRYALYHYTRAVELATDAGDAHCQARALQLAGLACVEDGHPNDGLKILQAAQAAAWNIPRGDPRRATAQACPLMDSATALAMLGDHQQAYRCIGQARDLWAPTPSDPYGDMDRAPALLEIGRGRLDLAEQFAAASARRWEGLAPVGRIRSGAILATIHVTAGEQRGLDLAHTAITAVTKLTSVRARKQLLPLAEALDTRPSADAHDLARMARQVAA